MHRMLILTAAIAGTMPVLAAAPVKMTAALTGAAEVPGPGADKGTGLAELHVDSAKGQICYKLMAQGTDTPTMAHIHKGAAGVAGGVVVSLAPPASGMSEGCAPLAADAMIAIIAHPSDYYVNVHTAAFSGGAMRGQLSPE